MSKRSPPKNPKSAKTSKSGYRFGGLKKSKGGSKTAAAEALFVAGNLSELSYSEIGTLVAALPT